MLVFNHGFRDHYGDSTLVVTDRNRFSSRKPRFIVLSDEKIVVVGFFEIFRKIPRQNNTVCPRMRVAFEKCHTLHFSKATGCVKI